MERKSLTVLQLLPEIFTLLIALYPLLVNVSNIKLLANKPCKVAVYGPKILLPQAKIKHEVPQIDVIRLDSARVHKSKNDV